MTTVYGIGAHTARNLYARGLRSVSDLEALYGVAELQRGDGAGFADAVNWEEDGEQEGGDGAVEKSIRLSLALREEFAQKCVCLFPPSEVGRVTNSH